MPSAGNIFGAITVFALGSMIFLAPDSMLPDRLTGGRVLAQQTNAQSSDPMANYLAKIEDADDDYFKAAIAIEKDGESPERLAKIKKADDSHFEAIIAFEAASSRIKQLAKIEAADDAYFKASMALEAAEQQAHQLAELKAVENTPAPKMLAQRSDDELVTGSIAENISPVAEGLTKMSIAADDDFETAIVVETSRENTENLAELNAGDESYFNTEIKLEPANAETKTARQADGSIKVAAVGGMSMPAAPITKKAPLPANVHKAKHKRTKKARRAPVYMARAKEKSRHDPIGTFLNAVVNDLILSPIHKLSKKPQ